jgi:hypothetical protein
MRKCILCGTEYNENQDFDAPGEVRVLSCRACPVDNIYAVCERCEKLERIEMDACPGCGAWNMWEIQKLVPAW